MRWPATGKVTGEVRVGRVDRSTNISIRFIYRITGEGREDARIHSGARGGSRP